MEYIPFDPIVKRTEATVELENGVPFKVTKGAPHVLCHLVSDPSVTSRVDADVIRFGEKGIRCLAVAKTMALSDEWKFVGMLTFLDPPRPDTKVIFF